MTDQGGYVRHLDPIIDDPRLSHKQRVCRLYRWALKELKHYITFENGYKFNLAYKVIRNRFEKYRYVTDPTMCDMMVRETQKYLRETCCTPLYYRYNVGAKDNILYHSTPQFYPDHAQNYDHWTPIEVMWYDDAKLHRYMSHHPMCSAGGEFNERFGEGREARNYWRFGGYDWVFVSLTFFYYQAFMHGFFYDTAMEKDPAFEKTNEYYNPNLRQSIEAEERHRRGKYQTSMMEHDWDHVMGYIRQKTGQIEAMGRYRVPGGAASVDPAM